VRKTFGGVVANDAISIDVPRGAIIGLIGPNGSGKTTLFNSIVGHHPIDGGSVRFEGTSSRISAYPKWLASACCARFSRLMSTTA
jgi:ABC-type branched-subunit amino acid transport system ATPase component